MTPAPVAIGLVGIAMEEQRDVESVQVLEDSEFATACRLALCDASQAATWTGDHRRHWTDAIDRVVGGVLYWEI